MFEVDRILNSIGAFTGWFFFQRAWDMQEGHQTKVQMRHPRIFPGILWLPQSAKELVSTVEYTGYSTSHHSTQFTRGGCLSLLHPTCKFKLNHFSSLVFCSNRIESTGLTSQLVLVLFFILVLLEVLLFQCKYKRKMKPVYDI